MATDENSTAPADGKILHILQHSLGVDEFGRGEQYRNHFCTGPGSDDHGDCLSAVSQGLMTRRIAPEGYGGMDFFFVTDSGRSFVADRSPSPPKLTRSQKRYRAWLDADCDMTFGEYITRLSALSTQEGAE